MTRRDQTLAGLLMGGALIYFDDAPPLGLAVLAVLMALVFRLMHGGQAAGLRAPVSAVWRAGRGQFAWSLAAIVAGMAAAGLVRWLAT